ncbi:lysosomal proton-coupled steroid conjugate and bile acid symporter SLC46A3-like [Haliotis asinina]|uniref:lysosomal proton-coupled steroid conjugate and bile acid symporter SLC46A3-like n=1 Tax=Haliotis asinina TaxID=109174 RepID=UPI003531E2EA
MDDIKKQDLTSSKDSNSNNQEKAVSYTKDRIVTTIVLMLYMCASMPSFPLFTQYIHSRYEDFYRNVTNSSSTSPGTHSPCVHNTSEEADKMQVYIQRSTSYEVLKLSLSVQVPSTIVNIVVGSYSDHIGRKMLFISPLLGCICRYAVFMLVVKFHLNLNFIILGTLLDGFSGSASTFILANMAYAADVTKTHATRTFAIVIADCSVSIAIAIGQLMTGFLIQRLGYFCPSVINTTLILLATVIVTYGLTETVKKKEVKEFSPVVHLKKVFGFYFNKSNGNTRCIFITSVIVFALIHIVNIGLTSIETLYQLGRPFCWDPEEIGYYGAYSTVFMAISGLIAIKLGSKCMRVEILAVTGMFLQMGSLILEGLASTDTMLYSVPFVSSISGVSVPVIRSVMSHMVDSQEQGAIFSSMAAVDTLSGAIGSATFTFLYSATVDTMRGMAFLVMAAIMLMAAVIMTVVIVWSPKQPEYVLIVSQRQDEEPTGAGCSKRTKLLGGPLQKTYLTMKKPPAVV